MSGATVVSLGDDAARLTITGDGSGPALSNSTPLIESGSGAAGTASTASRGDHVHPAQALPALPATTYSGMALGGHAITDAPSYYMVAVPQSTSSSRPYYDVLYFGATVHTAANLTTGAETVLTTTYTPDPNGAMAVSPDGDTAYVTTIDSGTTYVESVDLQTNTVITTVAITLTPPVYLLAVSPDGSTLVALTADGASIIDLGSSTESTVTFGGGAAVAGAFSPDGATFYCGGFTTDLYALDIASETVTTFSGVIDGTFLAALAVSSDGATIYLNDADATSFTSAIATWDVATEAITSTVALTAGYVLAGMVLSPDEARIIGGNGWGSGSALVFDIATGSTTVVPMPSVSGGTVLAPVLLGDGTTVAFDCESYIGKMNRVLAL